MVPNLQPDQPRHQGLRTPAPGTGTGFSSAGPGNSQTTSSCSFSRANRCGTVAAGKSEQVINASSVHRRSVKARSGCWIAGEGSCLAAAQAGCGEKLPTGWVWFHRHPFSAADTVRCSAVAPTPLSFPPAVGSPLLHRYRQNSSATCFQCKPGGRCYRQDNDPGVAEIIRRIGLRLVWLVPNLPKSSSLASAAGCQCGLSRERLALRETQEGRYARPQVHQEACAPASCGHWGLRNSDKCAASAPARIAPG